MPLSGVVLIIGILLGITTLIGILGNISVCLVVFWNRSMRTQLHLLLVNLAIADVGMSASCMPFAVATVLFHEQTIGKRFCYFNGFINTFFALASVLTICSLCVYQYVSVVLPLNKSLTNFRCLVMVLSAWAISIFLAIGPVLYWGRYEFTSNIFNCEYYHTTKEAEISYNITLMLCGYLFPCAFMLFSYLSVLRALHKHQSRMAVYTSSISPAPAAGSPVTLETKLCMTMSVVFLTFVVCRTPFFVFLVLATYDLGNPPDFLGQLSFWAIYLHSACDPFIYAFKHTEFQETLKDILRTFRLAITASCCFCSSKDSVKEKHVVKEKK